MAAGVFILINKGLHQIRPLVLRKLHGLPKRAISPRIKLIDSCELCPVCVHNGACVYLLALCYGEALTSVHVWRLVKLVLEQ